MAEPKKKCLLAALLALAPSLPLDYSEMYLSPRWLEKSGSHTKMISNATLPYDWDSPALLEIGAAAASAAIDLFHKQGDITKERDEIRYSKSNENIKHSDASNSASNSPRSLLSNDSALHNNATEYGEDVVFISFPGSEGSCSMMKIEQPSIFSAGIGENLSSASSYLEQANSDGDFLRIAWELHPNNPFADLGIVGSNADCIENREDSVRGGDERQQSVAAPKVAKKAAAKVKRKRIEDDSEQKEAPTAKKKPPGKKPRFSIDTAIELGEHDVVMGRGGMANNHIGNQRFRSMAKELKPAYIGLRNDKKTGISKRLVQMVHDKGGEFLAKDESSGVWRPVDFKQARRKASQALREENRYERAAKKRRRLS